MDYITSNLSNTEMTERFVGAHTFKTTLERLHLSYRQIALDMTEQKGLFCQLLQKLSEISSKLDVLEAKMGAQHEHRSLSPGQSEEREAQNSPPPPRQAVTPSPPSFNSNFRRSYGVWPENLFSLKQKRLSDVLFQYFWEDLAMAEIPKNGTPGRRSYELVRQCLGICTKFGDMSTIPLFPKNGSAEEKRKWTSATTLFAQCLERDITEFINAEKRKNRSRVRERLIGGTVSAIVKAWDQIPPAAKEQLAQTKRLYSQFNNSSVQMI